VVLDARTESDAAAVSSVFQENKSAHFRIVSIVVATRMVLSHQLGPWSGVRVLGPPSCGTGTSQSQGPDLGRKKREMEWKEGREGNEMQWRKC
jgi:hypothetical protein